MNIEIKKVMEHWEIFIDGKRFSSCDNWTEIYKDLKEIEETYNGP